MEAKIPFNINEIRSELVHGGWRPSHFQVIITNPFDGSADLKIPFMVKAASFPTYTIGQIPVQYFGRTVYVPGDRQVEPWNTTVINDEDFLIRNALEVWQLKINSMQGNISSTNVVNELKSTATITAFGKDGRILRTYQMNGIFPMVITGIEGDWASQDTIGEFPVTWSYDDCVVVGGITGEGGDV